MGIAYFSELSPSRGDRNPRQAVFAVLGGVDGVRDCSVGEEAVVSLEDLLRCGGGRDYDGGNPAEFQAHDWAVRFR